MGSVEDARYDKEFMNKPDVQERFKRFYQRSCEEIKSLNVENKYDIPTPSVVIFGHTHQPFGWGSEDMHVSVPDGRTIRLYNTGGWLMKRLDGGKTEFCGAELFRYETGAEFSSVSIR